MMKKVLFVQPPFERTMGYRRYYTHPGLLALAAVVEAGKHKVMVYDADYDTNALSYDADNLMNNYQKYIETLNDMNASIWSEIKTVIGEYNPDVVCVTVLTVTQESAKMVIKIAREINQNVIIAVGGVHPTLKPEDCLQYADYVIVNEGENVILDVINECIPKGIVYGKRVMDLDSLPFPAVHSLYGIEKYAKRDLSMVISTRGCPNRCAFCCSSAIWKRKVTRKSVDYFVREMEMLNEKYGIQDFFISDDSFTYDRNWLIEFCEKMENFNFTWRCLSRLDMISDEILIKMKKAGCRNIKFGIESGSQRILDRVHKKIRVEDVYKVDRLMAKHNMDWSAFFIVGFPEETIEDIMMTQEMIKKISAKSITVSVFTPYPGTELNENLPQDAKYYSHHSPYNNFTKNIPNEIFAKLVHETIEIAKRSYDEHKA